MYLFEMMQKNPFTDLYSLGCWIIVLLMTLYIIFPVDFIPDFGGAFGFLDDVIIFIWCLAVLKSIVVDHKKSKFDIRN